MKSLSRSPGTRFKLSAPHGVSKKVAGFSGHVGFYVIISTQGKVVSGDRCPDYGCRQCLNCVCPVLLMPSGMAASDALTRLLTRVILQISECVSW